ncbi:hypothetical protein Syun_029505 [Stephania yunnanensis]|uniref:Uncharacterized protein n=1 Tax=Stephania yunnanensis TaxID=152371 RepID=A0AAP0E5R3_9MAGN
MAMFDRVDKHLLPVWPLKPNIYTYVRHGWPNMTIAFTREWSNTVDLDISQKNLGRSRSGERKQGEGEERQRLSWTTSTTMEWSAVSLDDVNSDRVGWGSAEEGDERSNNEGGDNEGWGGNDFCSVEEALCIWKKGLQGGKEKGQR